MDVLTGCPDEAMLAIAEITALSHWKVTEQRCGTLSVRELVRRGDDIEQRMCKNQVDLPCDDVDQTPLHLNLVQQTLAVTEPGVPPFPSDNVLRQICRIFRESCSRLMSRLLTSSIRSCRDQRVCGYNCSSVESAIIVGNGPCIGISDLSCGVYDR